MFRVIVVAWLFRSFSVWEITVLPEEVDVDWNTQLSIVVASAADMKKPPDWSVPLSGSIRTKQLFAEPDN